MDIALRAIVLYLFVIFTMRVIGRRELASLSPVDLVLLIVLGDAIQQGLTQADYSVTGAIIAVATIGSMQVLMSYVTFRSRRARKVLEGLPIVIIQNGTLIDANLRREWLSRDEVAEAMRMQQIASFEDVEWAIVEGTGQISFIQKGQHSGGREAPQRGPGAEPA
jgi:uncharacterized membrane protein YcaP (DUF421 family)